MLLPGHFISQLYNISDEDLKLEKILNINTIRDMPVFIDPFNLFYNEKYKELHKRIIDYILFLQSKSSEREQSDVELKTYYVMSEIKETWLGYTKIGNRGKGFGLHDAKLLDKALRSYMSDIGKQKNGQNCSDHFEKFCIFSEGVGADTISDFITNIILEWLLNFTQDKCKRLGIATKLKEIDVISVDNIKKQMFFRLPCFLDSDDIEQYIILVPTDMLKKGDKMHIGFETFCECFRMLAIKCDDDVMVYKLNTFIQDELSAIANKEEEKKRIRGFLSENEDIANVFISMQEKDIKKAIADNEASLEFIDKKYLPLISETYIKIKEQIESCNNARDACEIAITVFNKQIVESIENQDKSFGKDEIESLFFLSCLGVSDKVIIGKIKLGSLVAMKFMVHEEEFLFEFRKARAKNKKNIVVDLEQRTINGMLCVISTTLNEYINAVKNINEYALVECEYNKIKFLNYFIQPEKYCEPTKNYYYNGSKTNQKVFISYRQLGGNSKRKEDLRDRLNAIMRYDNLTLIEDSQIKEKDNIEEFMLRIREYDYFIMLIQKEYFDSAACMFEVTEAMKENDFDAKYLPIIVDEFCLYDNEFMIAQIQSWTKKYKELENNISLLSEATSKIEPLKRLKKIKAIMENIGNFIEKLTNNLNFSLLDLEKKDYAKVVKYIRLGKL